MFLFQGGLAPSSGLTVVRYSMQDKAREEREGAMANQLSRRAGGVEKGGSGPLSPSAPLMRLKQIMSGSSSAFALHAKNEPRCVLTHPEFNRSNSCLFVCLFVCSLNS